MPQSKRSFLAEGVILDGKYRIERQLGKGGMGAVYLATHLGTTRTVALKIIVPELAARDEFVIRFRREAEAAGRLRHPNVVNVTDFGLTTETGKSLAYLVMEYLDGRTLADYQSAEGRPPLDLVVDIVEQIALALDAAHQAGIVHRDLKPENVWLESNRRGGYNVKVLDFGIAKLASPVASAPETNAPASSALASPPPDDPDGLATMAMPSLYTTGGSHLETQAGAMLGTPSYMSPEQCRGETVDFRSDIYGLATVAYEMLTGSRPFESDSLASLMRMQIEQPAVAPSRRDAAIPKAVSDAVLQGLEKDPTRRPRSAGTLAALIRAGAEAEFSVMRQARDVFNSNISYFLPSWGLSFGPALLSVVLALLAAPWAAKMKLLPENAIAAGVQAIACGATLFGLQLFKAAVTLLLGEAASAGSFRPATRRVFTRLVRRFPDFVRTQAASLLDLRPSSYRDNLLWPVVWAQEGRSGRDALSRSRELCRTVPSVAWTMAPRQYSPALVSALAVPAVVAAISVAGLRELIHQIAVGGPARALAVEPLLFSFAIYMRYGPAYPFLYWFAALCRGDGVMPGLPAAGLKPRKKRNPSRQPTVLLWTLLPLIFLALLVVAPLLDTGSASFDSALSDGRSGAILKQIDAGIGVNTQGGDGWTALHAAASRGDLRLAEALLARGANPNLRARDGSTALLVAADYNRADMAALLLDRGALVAPAGPDGRTALIFAAMRGNAAIVSLLLAHGADSTARDNAGKTAIDYAREEAHPEVAALLAR